MSTYSALTDEGMWRALHRILDTIPLPENRATVLRYLKKRKADGMKSATLGVDANALRGFCVHLGEKRLEDVTEEDVIGYFAQPTSVRRWCNANKAGHVTVVAREEPLGASTVEKRKEVLRPFFRWFRGLDEGYPPEVKRLKSRNLDDEDSIPVDELIERNEILRLIQAHEDPQEKARLAVLREAGLRAAEFCSLQIRSVVWDEYGAVLLLPKKTNGKRTKGLKTGSRRVRIIDSAPYLRAWFEVHPRKKDPDAPLWFSNSHRAPGKRLSENALWTFCVKAGVKAGLSQHTNPHLFRHSAATEKARMGWNEPQLRAYFGWSKNSDMPRKYVHLAGLDYEDMELERRGLKAKGSRTTPALAGIRCPGCNLLNVPTVSFCASCKRPIAPEAEGEIETMRQDAVREEVARLVGDMSKEDLAGLLQRALLAPGARP